jgi:hypothetical protein
MAAGPDKLAPRLGTLRSTHDHALLPENYELRAETERLKSRVQQSLQSEDSASPQEGIEACSWHAPPDGPPFPQCYSTDVSRACSFAASQASTSASTQPLRCSTIGRLPWRTQPSWTAVRGFPQRAHWRALRGSSS